MEPRVEQPSEFFPRASRASRRHLEDLADSLHRLPSAAEDLQVIIPRCNGTLLLQGGFCITLIISGYAMRSIRMSMPKRVRARTWRRPLLRPPGPQTPTPRTLGVSCFLGF